MESGTYQTESQSKGLSQIQRFIDAGGIMGRCTSIGLLMLVYLKLDDCAVRSLMLLTSIKLSVSLLVSSINIIVLHVIMSIFMQIEYPS